MANYGIKNPGIGLGADYVVEQGINYTKWNSGRLEMRFTKSYDIPVNQNYGGQKQSSYTPIGYPVAYISIISVVAQTAHYAAWGTMINNDNTQIRFTAPASTGNMNKTVHFIVEARWK